MLEHMTSMVEISARFFPTTRDSVPPYRLGEPVSLEVDRFLEPVIFENPRFREPDALVGIVEDKRGALQLVVSIFTDDSTSEMEDHVNRLNNHLGDSFKCVWVYRAHTTFVWRGPTYEDGRPTLEEITIHLGVEGTNELIGSGSANLGMDPSDFAALIMPRRRHGVQGFTTWNHMFLLLPI